MSTTQRKVLRISLVAVWLGTALVSAIEARGQSLHLLLDAGLRQPAWQAMVIWSGVALDTVLGLALWLKPGRHADMAALSAMALMTLVATLLSPELWLHPLGPLLKNLPIAAVLWALIQDDTP